MIAIIIALVALLVLLITGFICCVRLSDMCKYYNYESRKRKYKGDRSDKKIFHRH